MRNQEGQALLIVLLLMSVVTTVALSVVSRSITDIATTAREEESLRAFSAAEAGIEQALVGAGNESLPSGGTFSVSQVQIAQNQTFFNIPTPLDSGEAGPIWFAAHSGDTVVCDASNACFTGTQATFCWGEDTSSGNSLAPALELVLFYKTENDSNFNDARIARIAIDPRSRGNGFDTSNIGTCSGGIDGKTYVFSRSIDFGSLGVASRPSSSDKRGLYMGRVRLLYNTDKAHPVGLKDANANLPSQGTQITSTGSAGSSSDVTRKIVVHRLFSDIPPIFDFAISTIGNLQK